MSKIYVRKTKDGKRYFYDFWHKKARYRRITNLNKTDTYKAGQKALEKLEKDYFGIPDPVFTKPILFEKFADQFLEEYSKINKRPASSRSDENSLRHLKAFFNNRYLSSIGPELVEKYKAERIKEVSPASVNRELSCLKTLLNKAVEWGKIPVNPIAGKTVKKFPENNKKQRVLTSDEIARLGSQARGILRTFLIVALNTGMRRNEVLSLRWTDVDFIHGEINIRAEASKSKRDRTIPMNKLVADALRELPKKRNSLVFFNEDTGTNIKDIKTSFKTACRKANIAGVRIHDLRHTAATKMIEAGVDIMTVKEILGHSSIETTMRYCHPSRETKVRAVDKLAEAFNAVDALGKKVGNETKAGLTINPASYSFMYN